MPFALLTSGEGAGEALVGSGFNLASIMQNAITAVQNDIFSVLAVVVPVIAVVVGAVVGVKFGIRWLKSLGKA